jgi:hypothetical protein
MMELLWQAEEHEYSMRIARLVEKPHEKRMKFRFEGEFQHRIQIFGVKPRRNMARAKGSAYQ